MAAERASGAQPISRPHLSGVDETMDDASAPLPPTQSARAIPTPAPATLVEPEAHVESKPSLPRTLAEAPRTLYTPPAPIAVSRTSSPPPESVAPPSMSPVARRSRGLLFVLLCFVLGAMIAAGVAWKMGKLGGDDGEDRFVARATDAMYKNRFADPAGDNVRDITDEGLRRWPGSRRLIDVRTRASSALVVKAQGARSSGDVADALRLAKLARELDPNVAAAKRLVDQYEAELATFAAPSAAPLDKPAPLATGATGSGKPLAPQAGHKVLLEIGLPRVGQGTELTARVAPPKGTFVEPTFVVTGPGAPSGARVLASSPVAGVFLGSYAFVEPGKYEIAFTTQIDGKTLRATRTLVAGDPSAPRPPASATPAPTAPTPTAPPTAAPSASVKWM